MQLSESLGTTRCVILLHATVPGMTLKALANSFLVDKAYLRNIDACNHNKKTINISTVHYIIFNLLKPKSFLKVLFALTPVNKDSWYIFCGKSL